MQSLTITGLIVIVVGFVLNKVGLPLAEGSLETTITTLVQIVGFIIAYIGRMRQGDITLLGKKKVVKSNTQ